MTSASEPATSSTARTPLHAWHAEHGARMVPFSGYEMPLHYAGGIIGEHLATRTGAGLFDVCHMGRFRIRGAKAGDRLSKVLSSNVTALAALRAQYTFLATEDGGAVDDAYLYRLAEDDYLLVVNAANRERDWQWLEAHGVVDAGLHDETEASAMIALQGPRSEQLLFALAEDHALPAPQRGVVAHCRLLGRHALVARTGYTGEQSCFEIVVDADDVLALWQRLIDDGASTVGLGARDSLRLQAGLPLYGHELGVDRNGNTIPLFANALARFGVRPPGHGDYIGREALDAQRTERERIERGDADDGWAPSIVTHCVQCVVADEGRRPIRAGHTVLHDGAPVGYLTSGAVAPLASADAVNAAGKPVLDRIGLALLESRFRPDPSKTVQLEARDERGQGVPVTIVARHRRARAA